MTVCGNRGVTVVVVRDGGSSEKVIQRNILKGKDVQNAHACAKRLYVRVRVRVCVNIATSACHDKIRTNAPVCAEEDRTTLLTVDHLNADETFSAQLEYLHRRAVKSHSNT